VSTRQLVRPLIKKVCFLRERNETLNDQNKKKRDLWFYAYKDYQFISIKAFLIKTKSVSFSELFLFIAIFLSQFTDEKKSH